MALRATKGKVMKTADAGARFGLCRSCAIPARGVFAVSSPCLQPSGVSGVLELAPRHRAFAHQALQQGGRIFFQIVVVDAAGAAGEACLNVAHAAVAAWKERGRPAIQIHGLRPLGSEFAGLAGQRQRYSIPYWRMNAWTRTGSFNWSASSKKRPTTFKPRA
jgi:hypothetical protein